MQNFKLSFLVPQAAESPEFYPSLFNPWAEMPTGVERSSPRIGIAIACRPCVLSHSVSKLNKR